MPTPEQVAKFDQFAAMCEQLFDWYVSATECDLNNYAQAHGKPVDQAQALHDVTLMLHKGLEPANLAGLVAHAVLREVERKARGGRA